MSKGRDSLANTETNVSKGGGRVCPVCLGGKESVTKHLDSCANRTRTLYLYRPGRIETQRIRFTQRIKLAIYVLLFIVCHTYLVPGIRSAQQGNPPPSLDSRTGERSLDTWNEATETNRRATCLNYRSSL